MRLMEDSVEGLLHMTDHVVKAASLLVSHFPHAPIAAALRRTYPYHISPAPLNSKGRSQRHDLAVVADALNRSNVDDEGCMGRLTTHLDYTLTSISRHSDKVGAVVNDGDFHAWPCMDFLAWPCMDF